ncbi:MAG: hypothetical protein JXR97_05245 [Planctomycetes bacterium]|nr:hypothetical protein [Planctomycetota bacterium]
MTIEAARTLLLYCFGINTGILCLWFVMLVIGKSWIYRLHSRIFGINEEELGRIHYAGMITYKMAIILFLFVPWLVLTITG